MSASRRLFAVAIGISCSGALGLLACNDDSTSTPANTDSGVDASNIVEDTGGGNQTDATVNGPETGVDAAKPKTDGGDAGDAGVDAAVVADETVKSTGHVLVQADFAFAEFYVDDINLRWANSPECVAAVRSPVKATASAGVVTIAGDIVGKDGGPSTKVELVEADGYAYTGSDPTILPLSNEFTVDVTESAAASFSALPVQTLQTSLNLPIAVTAPKNLPLPPAAGLDVPTTKPFDITWTAPAGPGDLTNQRVIVDLAVSPSASQDVGKAVNLYCAFPLTAGKGSIPANVLADVKSYAGGGDISAVVTILAGGQRAVTIKNTFYVVEVARADSTDSTPGTINLK